MGRHKNAAIYTDGSGEGHEVKHIKFNSYMKPVSLRKSLDQPLGRNSSCSNIAS